LRGLANPVEHRRIPRRFSDHELLEDEEVSGLAVNVETFKGVVQLSGFAKTEAERQKAVQLARSVGGVKDIKNDIRLK
jgi:osmotically-inducible protein OsmY